MVMWHVGSTQDNQSGTFFESNSCSDESWMTTQLSKAQQNGQDIAVIRKKSTGVEIPVSINIKRGTDLKITIFNNANIVE